MKKVVFFVLVSMVMVSGSVLATNSPIVFTASVKFEAVGEVKFEATLSKGGSQLTWDATKIKYGQTDDQWKPATDYIIMKSTITKAGGKVFFYQDNKSAAETSKYVAVSSRTEREWDKVEKKFIEVDLGKYNGLVRGGSKGGQNGYLPMDFVVSTYTFSSDDMIQSSVAAAGTYGTRYLTDKSDEQLNADKKRVAWSTSTYCMVAGPYGFVQDIANEAGDPGYIQGVNATGYIYIGANFKNVISEESYGSDKIKFEIVSE